jgi:RNA-directed DNA polymerase
LFMQPKRGGKGIAGMLKTPEGIRTLQRKLYRKAKQEPACRFHALYDKVYRADILSHAYNLVRANKGGVGIDGVSFAAIEEGKGAAAFIAELAEALRDKTYQPDPVKRVMIPKGDGRMRPLGIPTIRDRGGSDGRKLVIEPIFEADFCENSYGFRPGKSAHNAVDDVAYAMNTGFTRVIDADLSGYFDTIPHANLMAVVAERICDGAMLHLIRTRLFILLVQAMPILLVQAGDAFFLCRGPGGPEFFGSGLPVQAGGFVGPTAGPILGHDINIGVF